MANPVQSFFILFAIISVCWTSVADAGGAKVNNVTPSMARTILIAAMSHEMDTVASADLPSSLAKTEANTTCIMTYCTDAALACVKDQACRTALSCLSTCDSLEDDSPDKIELQKCTADCVVTYENEALDAVNGCFDSHDCIALTPIPLACRDTHPAFPIPQNVTDMEGAWWATWGKNAVYDCYPCQRLSFSPLNASSWLYTSKYLTPTLEGGVRAYELQAAFPWPADGMATAIAFNYTYQGMSHGEEWRFLHVAPSLVVLYYCGQGNTWQYEGGLVLSRERSSPPDHVSLAAEAFAKIGIDFEEEFCELQPNRPCPAL
ncbi:violaxanthin de-epoxidase [Nannochloropsis gaditana CCMP526]|uniref:violaxanthin de-epoxidase n=1 Tax=Nannochloropsis gaditana (strain CCMP526) TaxID=1093141 RepID=UPI00029F6730|nr:violaxanthin de-epoxidase [Nannochloropsis gaditana CCMP526]EKU21082.1 violaxanthin de-epoxidase [Nannochloropsis gaditana CCMP526]|eukprot:XP_005855281.1 violaxanthin de-epoxidase [Nannochloropsis gaditana CCMP526]